MNRRAQPAITIRSRRAVDRLRLLMRDGRSQARVIEEALDRMPLPAAKNDLDERRAQLEAILDRVAEQPRRFTSMAEFDAQEYDERGNPR